MTREQYIELHKDLFWYTPADKKAEISDSLLVETILNDGTLDDYKSLLQVLSAQRVAEVFFAAKGRQKQNYYPEIHHFYSLQLTYHLLTYVLIILILFANNQHLQTHNYL